MKVRFGPGGSDWNPDVVRLLAYVEDLERTVDSLAKTIAGHHQRVS